MNVKIIVIIIAVILIGGGAAAYFMLFAPETEVVHFYTPGEFFVTNVIDSNRLFKVTVVMQLSDDTKDEDLILINHIIRDTIIKCVRTKDEDYLRDPVAMDLLRVELTDVIRGQLAIDYLTTVYFNDFVLQ